MTTWHMIPFVVMLSLAWTGPCLAQSALTEQDVRDAVNDPGFNEALGSCFGPQDRPEKVTLVLVVSDSGGVSLAGMQQTLPPKEATCVGLAVTGLPMPQTGHSFQITVTLPVPESTAPPPEVQEEAPVAVPVTPVSAKPVTIRPIAGKKSVPEWRYRYSKGKKLFIGGIVSLAVGADFLLAGGLLVYLTQTVLCDEDPYWHEEHYCRLYTGLGITLLSLGAVATIMGGILLSRGTRIKREALKSKPVLSVAPLPRGEGIVLGLAWAF